MTVAMTDDKRRLTMPKELAPKSPVTIQQITDDSWIITRQKPISDLVVVALPCIKELPADPDWEALELRMANQNNRNVPRFEE
jgi:hypothetical protein